jgi:hypothetical protein
MKFISTTVLIILFSFLSCLYFPWWTIAVVAFVISVLIPQSAQRSFFSGFTALFILWGGLSMWISIRNGHILAHRVSLLILKADSPFLLILTTAFLGALVGGLSALAASFVRQKNKEPAQDQ